MKYLTLALLMVISGTAYSNEVEQVVTKVNDENYEWTIVMICPKDQIDKEQPVTIRDKRITVNEKIRLHQGKRRLNCEIQRLQLAAS